MNLESLTNEQIMGLLQQSQAPQTPQPSRGGVVSDLSDDELLTLLKSGGNRGNSHDPSNSSLRDGTADTNGEPIQASAAGTAGDVATQLGYGLVEGAASIPGLQGDVRGLIDAGIDWGAEKLGFAPRGPRPSPMAPTTRDVLNAIKPITGEMPASDSLAGQYARTTGQFATGALAPGGAARRVIGGVMAPAFASETAGQIAPEGWENAFRIGGGIAGGLAGGIRTPPLGSNARADQIVGDMLTPQAQATLRELGPDAFLLEANPTLQQTAQGVVQRPGSASEQLRTAVTDRHLGTPERLQSDIRATLGPPVAPSRVELRIREAQRELGPDYTAAVRDMPSGDVRPILDSLQRDIAREAGAPRRALDDIRQMFFDQRRLKTSPEELLNIRQAIDDMAPRFEGQNNALRLIGEYRQAVDDAIRAAAPSVKAVDARFEELARQRDALNQGGQVLATGAEAMRPSELRQAMAGMTPAQQASLRMGTRAEIDRILGTSVYDVNAIRNAVKSEGKWNHEKLAQIFGRAEADGVMNAVDREAAFRRTYNDLIANSQTAPRIIAEEMTRVRGPGNITPEMVAGMTGTIMSGGNPIAGAAAATATGGARGLWQAVTAGGQRRLDRALTDRLGATGPNRDALVQQMLDEQAANAARMPIGAESALRAAFGFQGGRLNQ